MAVETDLHERLPDTVLLPQTGVDVGRHDEPAPTVEHRYVRTEDAGGEVVYRYALCGSRLRWRGVLRVGSNLANFGPSA